MVSPNRLLPEPGATMAAFGNVLWFGNNPIAENSCFLMVKKVLTSETRAVRRQGHNFPKQIEKIAMAKILPKTKC